MVFFIVDGNLPLLVPYKDTQQVQGEVQLGDGTLDLFNRNITTEYL